MAESFSIKAILSAKDAGFSSGMKGALASLKELSAQIKGGFTFGVMAKAGASAFSTISGSVSGLTREAVETSDAMQKLQQAMKFSGDYTDKEIEKIAGLNGALKKYADETVFDLNDVMSTFGALSANGVKDAEKLTQYVGNAVAVFGGGAEEYSRVGLAFSQAMSAGKLSAEDWNQILDASPQLAGGLRKELMKLNPKLAKDFKGAMAKGAISADLLGEAMTNIGMQEMAQEAATSVTTFEGAMGNLEATVSGGLLTIYDSIAKSGIISAINGLNKKLESGFDWLATNLPNVIESISPYWNALKSAGVEVASAFGEAFSEIGGSLSQLTGAFGATDSIKSFSDVVSSAADALKSFAGFLKDHSDVIAKVISKLPKLLVAYKGFKIVKALAPSVKAFSGAILSLAKKGIGSIAGKLFGIAAGEKATGAASSVSAKQVLASAVAFIALGAGVALAGVGLALIAQAAIALANQGALAVGVMGGLVVALAGLAFGASVIGSALTAGAVGFVAFGAAMVLVGAGMALAAGFIRNLVPLVKQIGDTAAQMAGAVAGAVTAVISSVGQLVGNIADGVSQIVTCIGEELCNVFETAGNAISGVVDSISGGIATVVDAISGGFRSVLDGIAGVIESIGSSARNAGEGFRSVAEGISIIAGLSLLDIAKSLGAVAVGIGEISAAGEGMGVIGEGVRSIAAAIQALSVGQVILASMAQSGEMASQAAVGYFTLAAAIQEIATVSTGVLEAAISLQSLLSVAVTSSAAIATLGAVLLTASGAARNAGTGVLSVSGALNGVNRSGSAAVGAIHRLASVAHSVVSAIRPVGNVGKQAMSTLIQSFSAAAAKAKVAGNAIGKGVLTSVRQGISPLPKIATQAMNSLTSALKSGGNRATANARSMAEAIVKAFRGAIAGATNAGRYIGIGLANGMASQLGRVRSVAAQMASAAERAIRAKARIHSPSKVSQALGEYWGTGYAVGISGMERSVRKASERLVTVPTLAAGPDLSYHGSLEQDFDYCRNTQYTIQVPVTVDGREFARVTATYTQEELNKRQTRNSRKHGIL